MPLPRRERIMKPAGRRLALMLLLLSSGCVLTVADGHVDPPDLGADPIAAGRRAYATRCASCHGLEARGDGPVGPALTSAPPDLTWLAERNGGEFPRDYVIAVTTGDALIPAHGTRDMPVWSDRLMPPSGAGAAASIYLRRTVEGLADYLATLQRRLSARVARPPRARTDERRAQGSS